MKMLTRTHCLRDSVYALCFYLCTFVFSSINLLLRVIVTFKVRYAQDVDLIHNSVGRCFV